MLRLFILGGWKRPVSRSPEQPKDKHEASACADVSTPAHAGKRSVFVMLKEQGLSPGGKCGAALPTSTLLGRILEGFLHHEKFRKLSMKRIVDPTLGFRMKLMWKAQALVCSLFQRPEEVGRSKGGIRL